MSRCEKTWRSGGGRASGTGQDGSRGDGSEIACRRNIDTGSGRRRMPPPSAKELEEYTKCRILHKDKDRQIIDQNEVRRSRDDVQTSTSLRNSSDNETSDLTNMTRTSSDSNSSCSSDSNSSTSGGTSVCSHRMSIAPSTTGDISSRSVNSPSSSPLVDSMICVTPDLRYVDSHCHLDFILENEYKTLPNLMQYFPPTLEALITNIVFPQSFKWLDDYLRSNYMPRSIFWTVGFHPHAAKYFDSSTEQTIIDRLSHERCLAIGEAGIDYSRNVSDRQSQMRCFRSQCLLAVAFSKPLVVHSRDAADDVFAILSSCLPPSHPIHMHCFNEGTHWMRKLMSHFSCVYFGVTGAVTFQRKKEQRGKEQRIERMPSSSSDQFASSEASSSECCDEFGMSSWLGRCPLNRLLLETDGPYMSPFPYRGRTSHPGMIGVIAAKVADIKGIHIDDVIRETRKNTREVYGI